MGGAFSGGDGETRGQGISAMETPLPLVDVGSATEESGKALLRDGQAATQR
jgi:hypothetical protein